MKMSKAVFYFLVVDIYLGGIAGLKNKDTVLVLDKENELENSVSVFCISLECSSSLFCYPIQ